MCVHKVCHFLPQSFTDDFMKESKEDGEGERRKKRRKQIRKLWVAM